MLFFITFPILNGMFSKLLGFSLLLLYFSSQLHTKKELAILRSRSFLNGGLHGGVYDRQPHSSPHSGIRHHLDSSQFCLLAGLAGQAHPTPALLHACKNGAVPTTLKWGFIDVSLLEGLTS